MIIERLEDPQRPGPWDRRGMVVGDVQSGKTSNYTGLICKAADAGYSVIIILAGMYNSLRSKTQDRIDLGFLGFDTEKNPRPMAGKIGRSFRPGTTSGRIATPCNAFGVACGTASRRGACSSS